MQKAVFHGECVIKKVSISVPKEAKKIKSKNGAWVIADSENTGNHHLVLENDGVDVYELNGVLYVTNEVEAIVKCVDENRHDSITLEPGVWEIQRANEYDFLKDEKRKVAD